MMRRFAIGALLALYSVSSMALTIDTPLPAPEQEARARALFSEIRCMVCQGESIADSPAEVARDMRVAVREQIASGQSDAAIKDLLVQSYGDSVLMRPPLSGSTLLLWFGPLLILAGAAYALLRFFRRRPPS